MKANLTPTCHTLLTILIFGKEMCVNATAHVTRPTYEGAPAGGDTSILANSNSEKENSVLYLTVYLC